MLKITVLLTPLDKPDARPTQRAAIRHIGGHADLYGNDAMTYRYASKIALRKKLKQFSRRINEIKPAITMLLMTRRSAANKAATRVA